MPANVLPISPDIQVIIEDDDESVRVDPSTGTIEVDRPDGGVDVHLDAKREDEESEDDGWFANLADKIGDAELGKIASELMEAIQADDRSREGSLNNHARGLTLLGIELKEPGSGTADNSSAVDGQSTVTNPLLLEAVLKGWATAQAELLPAAGPVKIKDDGDESAAEDDLAESFERDFNHWFTTTAKEYYPDTRHMLLWGTYFKGKGFKKVYRCPIRRRPVSESVDAKDLIVSDATKDLRSCGRITHNISMRTSVMQRMMLIGAYRDTTLTQPTGKTDQVDEKVAAIQGTTKPTRPEDQPYTIWECQCELDLDQFIPDTVDDDEAGEPETKKHPLKGEGIAVPFVVSLDKDSQKILALRRDWDRDDADCERRRMYVEYGYIPGPGFYGTGLLNILGNSSAAMTGAWRLALDAGQFASFPGGLIKKEGTRQNTSDFRVGPGQFASVDTGSMKLSDIIMPMPYHDITAGLLSLMDKITQQSAAVGGTADIPTAEGIQNVPVGTMLAQIEQATKVEASVHKGLHTAQSDELELIKDLFREHPEDFWRSNKVCPRNYWNEQRFIQALDNVNLVPVSDPNVPSHIHRIAKALALVQLINMPTFGPLMDPQETLKRILRAIREDPAGLVVVPSPQAAPPDPKMVEANAKVTTAQTKAAESQAKAAALPQELALKQRELETKEKIAASDIVKEHLIHDNDAAKAAHSARIEQTDQELKAVKTAHDISQDHHERQQQDAEQGGAVVQEAHDRHMAEQQHGLEAVKTAHDMAMDRKAHELDVKVANKPVPKAKPKGKK